MVVGAIVMMCGCLISPVMHFGSGKSAHEAQHEEYERVTPASFAGDHKWAGDVSIAKIRVWADDAYRAQNLHWQQTLQDQLDAVNEVLAATFGVRLVADYRTWQRHAPGASLAESLDALAQVDAGDDVLSVVGMTSSISLVSATFEQLGLASVGGRHMIMRGYADVEERKMFETAFTELRAGERDLLYQSRRRHKTTAILLHELGHNLGAEHVSDEDTLMHETYSARSSAFDPHSHDVILATLDQRLHRGRVGAPAAEPATPEATTRGAASGVHPKLMVNIDDAGQHIVGGHALDGRLVAVEDGPLMTVVYRIRASGIEKVGRQKVAGVGEFGWTDSATLWVLDKDRDKITVHKLVAGALARTIDVPMSAWELTPTPDSLAVDLRITEGGLVWLESCQKRKSERDHTCVKGVFLRVDAPALERATAKPAGIDEYRVSKTLQEGESIPFPAVEAPLGYAIRLTGVAIGGGHPRTVRGAICTGPHDVTGSWPGPRDDPDQMKPTTVTWLRTSPAVGRIAGKGINPDGLVREESAYFVDCERVDRVENFGGGLWGIRRQERQSVWSIYIDSAMVGTIAASSLRAAPLPGG